MILTPGCTILFQGDSITDCQRRSDPRGLGNGYPALVDAMLTSAYPGMRVRVLNRGISGDRVRDLRARWTDDAIALQPDVLSILIGINDTWRRYDSGEATSADAFAGDYDAILARVKAETSAKLVLLEPFVLPCPPDREAWREDLDPKIARVRQLAAKYEAVYIPLDGMLASAGIAAGSWERFAADGVHPTLVGHALIKNAFMSAVGMG